MWKCPFFKYKKNIMQKTINLKKKINSEWKEFLTDYTTQKDVAKVSLDNDMGYHTLNGIKNRTINISNEKNKNALEALMQQAVRNAIAEKAKIEDDIKLMSSISDAIEIIESD